MIPSLELEPLMAELHTRTNTALQVMFDHLRSIGVTTEQLEHVRLLVGDVMTAERLYGIAEATQRTTKLLTFECSSDERRRGSR